MVDIAAFSGTSMQDHPDGISSIIFTQGCNFSCPSCYAKPLTEDTSTYHLADILEWLRRKKRDVPRVVICGGEPTEQSGLIDFLQRLKDMKMDVKLDTNGSNPEVLHRLL